MPSESATNPLLSPWTAPYGLAPFAGIAPAHFEPAFAQARQEHLHEIEAIANDPRAPDFENTLAAFDRCGRRLARIAMVFHNLCASETSSALQEVQRRMAPVLAAHYSAIHMHQGLFRRIDALHEQPGRPGLEGEQ